MAQGFRQRNLKSWSKFLMCSKSKYLRRIVLAEFRNRELLSRKLKKIYLCQNWVGWRPGSPSP